MRINIFYGYYWLLRDKKVQFPLEQTTKAQGGVEVQLDSFCNISARWGWVLNATFRALYPRKKDTVSIL